MFRTTPDRRTRHRTAFHDDPLALPESMPIDPKAAGAGASVAPPAPAFVAAFPLSNGLYSYWPETTPAGLRVMRSTAGLNRPAELVGSYPPAGTEFYYISDETATQLRLWKVAGPGAEVLGEVYGVRDRPGLAAGRRASAAVGDAIARAGAARINAANRAAWGR